MESTPPGRRGRGAEDVRLTQIGPKSRNTGHPPAGVSLRSWAAGTLASSLSKTINRSN